MPKCSAKRLQCNTFERYNDLERIFNNSGVKNMFICVNVFKCVAPNLLMQLFIKHLSEWVSDLV